MAQDVVDYAHYLGINPQREPHLLWIAQEGFNASLPGGAAPATTRSSREAARSTDGWTEHETKEGVSYFFNSESGTRCCGVPPDTI